MKNSNQENISYELTLDQDRSASFLDLSRKINIFSTTIIVFVGIIGHFGTVLVYFKKRFRNNSNNVYILCLAINDALFLAVHFFEDSIRTIKDLFSDELKFIKLLNSLNFVDQNYSMCVLLNYFRNVLRSISSYLILIFTLQRLYLVYLPLSTKFKSNKSAWRTVAYVAVLSFTLNLWVPFLFQIKDTHCDIKNDWVKVYHAFNNIYISMVILIPTFCLIICSTLLLIKTDLDDSRRKKLLNKKKEILAIRTRNPNKIVNIRPKPILVAQNRINSKKITRTLIFISLTYVFLNLPYSIVWFFYFNELWAPYKSDTVFMNYLFSIFQISEIFMLFNYGINFFFYCFLDLF